jgi:hypothetical protein
VIYKQDNKLDLFKRIIIRELVDDCNVSLARKCRANKIDIEKVRICDQKASSWRLSQTCFDSLFKKFVMVFAQSLNIDPGMNPLVALITNLMCSGLMYRCFRQYMTKVFGYQPCR